MNIHSIFSKTVMKKSIFAGLIAVWVLTVLSGCSKQSGNLYDCVSADAMFVLSGSPAETFKNSGCRPASAGFEVSEAVEKLLTSLTGSEREAVVTFLDGSGVDFDRAVTVIDPANSHLFITFMLDDEGNFRKWCEAREFSSRDSSGYTIYKTHGEISIAVKDSQAWVILGYQKGKEADYIKSLYTAAEKAPLPEWIREKIDNSEALGVSLNIGKYIEYVAARGLGAGTAALEGAMWQGYDTQAVMSGYFVYDCAFDGASARGKGSFYSADGEKLVNKAKIRPVNTSLLRYAAKDAAVAMISLPDSADWYGTVNALNQRLAKVGLGMDSHVATMTASVLENIDHTVMISGNVTDISTIYSVDGWNGTIAVDFREGKAYEYFEMIRSMADNLGFPSSTVGGDAFSFSIPNSGVTVYVKNDGNALVASLSPTLPATAAPAFERPFDNTLGGMIIDITKENPLAQFVSLPFGVNLTYTATADEIKFDISQTSTDGLLLANFIEYFADRVR